MNDCPISIVIPAFNQLDYCRQCVESIQQNTREPYRLILVDNGSADGVGAYFDSLDAATVIHTGQNLGFPAGSNRGLAQAEGHAVLLNSDTLVPEGWLARLKRALLSADDIGLVGPVSNRAPGPQQLDGLALRNQEEIEAFARALATERDGVVKDTYRLVGFCWMIRDEALQKVGLLDESFGLGNYEDDDFCLRMRKVGYRLAIAEDCFVFHHGGRTFEGMGMQGEAFGALLHENRERFARKWDLHLPEPPSPRARSRQLNAQAHEALDEGRFQQAVRLLKDAIAACPEDPMNYNDLAVVLHRMGQTALAHDCLTQALRTDPSCQAARDNLRVIAEALGRSGEGE